MSARFHLHGDMIPRSVKRMFDERSEERIEAESQTAVLSIRGRDPLQVITRGTPAALKVVTAGTYVCTAAVNATAPTGIRTAANCTGG